MIKVGINGFGTIGKRVASAVLKQDDMELVGVTKRSPDYALKEFAKHTKIYGVNQEFAKKIGEVLPVEGTLEDLLKDVDVIVDATPEGVGEENKKIYDGYNVKAIFEGGEEHELTGFSFNASANYDDAKGRKYVRVVSCNTTGLIRTLHPLNREIGLEDVKAILVRRATDPLDHKKGPINSIVPELKFPSHHGPDVLSVIGGFNIDTYAVKVPTTLMHVHVVITKLKRETTKDEITKIFSNSPRIYMVEKKLGIESTGQIMELAKELGRTRSDFFETVVWKDSIYVKGREMSYIQAVHQESIVVPENIDAIRAMFAITDKNTSIKKTNRSLGIIDKFN